MESDSSIVCSRDTAQRTKCLNDALSKDCKFCLICALTVLSSGKIHYCYYSFIYNGQPGNLVPSEKIIGAFEAGSENLVGSDEN